ncbi:Intraflagellar transport protein 74 [Amphibalanus amphitrite]|uniref:Intraflagellar transport protein 74 n=1 Tax=Amphibalanus amphitrite TaxID=1232801 RepID=A0A6A4VEC4_AMPAM|nr:Intraflagellar transport protein 74 [Amphibalanus amphitrite]
MGELDNMDANIQLGILERRLASIEQNNFALLEFVSAQRAEVDYGTVRGHVMHTVYEHNKRLMEETAAGRATL